MHSVYFPSPYPDETVYSMLARFQVHAGNTNYRDTYKEVIGSAIKALRMDLPGHLATIGRYAGMNDQELLREHTLLPFFAAFLPEQRWRDMATDMLNGTGNKVLYISGHMAGQLRTNQEYRYCRRCVSEDRRRYGEAYWHRDHQFPGIRVCPRHLELLVLVPAQKELLALDLMADEKFPAKQLSETAQDLHARLAADAVAVLRGNERFDKRFQEKCRIRLRQTGFACWDSGQIHETQLLQAWNEKFPDEVRASLEIPPLTAERNWLAYLLRRGRGSYHPLKSLLLVQLLWGSLENYLRDVSACETPFGSGPWPCLNKAVDHYGHNLIAQVAIRETGLILRGIFRCPHCGFTYLRQHAQEDAAAEEEMPDKADRIVTVGKQWIETVLALREQGKTVREIAALLDVHQDTVRKYIRKEPQESSTESDIAGRMNCQRVAWETIIILEGTAGVTVVRRNHPELYSWLYRNDREWLREHSPRLQGKHFVQETTVDWSERDRRIVQAVLEVVEQELRKEQRPRRLTKAYIGKIIHAKALLEKRLDKLPLTAELLGQVLETQEEYHLRKVQWAVKRIQREGLPLKGWQIERVATLRQQVSPRVKDLIEQLLNEEMVSKCK